MDIHGVFCVAPFPYSSFSCFFQPRMKKSPFLEHMFIEITDYSVVLGKKLKSM